MSIERLKTMKEIFMCAVEGQMYNLAEVDAEELGEVVDMIKDLSEAIYYCKVSAAMEEAEKHEGKEMMYYTPMYYDGRRSNGSNGTSYYMDGMYYTEGNTTDGRDMPRRYYNGNGGGNGGRGSSGGNQGGSS